MFNKPLYEQTDRKKFDFFSFNVQLINQPISDESVTVFDLSYIPKAGKSTYGRVGY